MRGVTAARGGESVTLSAADSYDLNDESLQYEWTQTHGPAVPAIGLCAQQECSFETPETRDGTSIRVRVRVFTETSKMWSSPTYLEVAVDPALVGGTRVIASDQFTAGFAGWRNEVDRKSVDLADGISTAEMPAEWDPATGTVRIPWEARNEYQGIYKDFDVTGNWYPDLPLGLRIRARAESIYEGREGNRKTWASRNTVVMVEIRDLTTEEVTTSSSRRTRGRQVITNPAERIYRHTVILSAHDWDEQPDHRIELGPVLRSRGLTKFRVALVRQSFVFNGWFQSLAIDEVRIETQDESNWNPAPRAVASVKAAVPLEKISGRVTHEGDTHVCVTPPQDFSGNDLAYVTVADPEGAEAVSIASLDVRNIDDDAPVALCAGSHRPIEVYGGDDVELDGRLSYDPEGETLSHEWSSPSGVRIRFAEDSSSASSTVVLAEQAIFPAPYVSEPTVYSFVHRVREATPGKEDAQTAECTTQVVVKPFPENANHRVCPSDATAHYDLADALAVASDGDVIEFCAEAHEIGGGGKAWTIDTAVTIRCEDLSGTILKGHAGDAVLKVQSPGVRVEGCTIAEGSVGIHVLSGRMLSTHYYRPWRGGVRRYTTYEWLDNLRFVGNHIRDVGIGIQVDGRQSDRVFAATRMGTKELWVRDSVIEADEVGIRSLQGVTGNLHIIDNEIRGHTSMGIEVSSRGLHPTKLRVTGNLFFDNGTAIATEHRRLRYGRKRRSRTFRATCNASCYRNNTYSNWAGGAEAPLIAYDPVDIQPTTDRVSCGGSGPATCVPIHVKAARAAHAPQLRQALASKEFSQTAYVILSLPQHGWLYCGGTKIDWYPANLRDEIGMRRWDCRYTPDAGFSGYDPFWVGAAIGNSDLNQQRIPIYVNQKQPEQSTTTEIVQEAGAPDDSIEVALYARDPEGDNRLSAALEERPLYGRVRIADGMLTYTPFGSMVEDCIRLRVSDWDGGSYARRICFFEDGSVKMMDEDEANAGEASPDTLHPGEPAAALESGEPATMRRGNFVNDGGVRVNGTSTFHVNAEGEFIKREQDVDVVVNEGAYGREGYGTLEQATMSSGQTVYIEAGRYDASGVVFLSGMSVFCHDDAVLEGPVRVQGSNTRFYNCYIAGDLDVGGYGNKTYYETGSRPTYSRNKGNYNRGTYDFYKQPYPESYDLRIEGSHITGSVVQEVPFGIHQYNWRWRDSSDTPSQRRGPHPAAPGNVFRQTHVAGNMPTWFAHTTEDTLDNIDPVLGIDSVDWIVSESVYAVEGIATFGEAMKAGQRVYLSAGTYNGLERIDDHGVTHEVKVPSNATIDCAAGAVIEGLSIQGNNVTVRNCHIAGHVTIRGSGVVFDGSAVDGDVQLTGTGATFRSSYIKGRLDLGGTTTYRYIGRTSVYTRSGNRNVPAWAHQLYPVTYNVRLESSVVGAVVQNPGALRDWSQVTQTRHRENKVTQPSKPLPDPDPIVFSADTVVQGDVTVGIKQVWEGAKRTGESVMSAGGIVVSPVALAVTEDTPQPFTPFREVVPRRGRGSAQAKDLTA